MCVSTTVSSRTPDRFDCRFGSTEHRTGSTFTGNTVCRTAVHRTATPPTTASERYDESDERSALLDFTGNTVSQRFDHARVQLMKCWKADVHTSRTFRTTPEHSVTPFTGNPVSVSCRIAGEPCRCLSSGLSGSPHSVVRHRACVRYVVWRSSVWTPVLR